MVLNTAQVLCEQKEYLKAEELLISQGEIIGMQPNIQYALGVTKRGQGKHEEAAKYFEKAQHRSELRNMPKYVWIIVKRQWNDSQSTRLLQRAIEIDNKFGAAMNNMDLC